MEKEYFGCSLVEIVSETRHSVSKDLINNNKLISNEILGCVQRSSIHSTICKPQKGLHIDFRKWGHISCYKSAAPSSVYIISQKLFSKVCKCTICAYILWQCDSFAKLRFLDTQNWITEKGSVRLGIMLWFFKISFCMFQKTYIIVKL